MKYLITILCLIFSLQVHAQNSTTTDPDYCDFDKSDMTVKGGSPLPKFLSQATLCYKVQVAILNDQDAYNFPFHPKLNARWRPCQKVWVIESKETCCDAQSAEKLKNELINLGYQSAFLTELVSYEPGPAGTASN